MAKWSAKDERQYEHVKASEQKRHPRRAKEIAARTVNKQRREEGRTGQSSRANSRTNGRRSTGGNGALKDQTRQELYDRARKLDIPGRSSMNKSQLVRAIQKSA